MIQLNMLNALADLLEQNKDFIEEFNEFKKKPSSTDDNCVIYS